MIISDLKDIFDDMLDAAPLDEHSTVTQQQLTNMFVNGIVDVICSAIEAGTTVSTYNGVCPLGTVTATVFNTFTSITVNPAVKTAVIAQLNAAMASMQSDSDWTDAVCSAAQTLLSGAIVTEVIAGTAIPPVVPPPTVPVAGTAMSASIQSIAPLAPIKAALNAACAVMSGGDNSAYATALGTALLAILSANQVTMAAQAPIAGLTAITVIAGIQ